MPSPKPQDRISLLIKAKQRETGLGVRAAASASGVSPATISRLVRATSSALPDIDTLMKISSWLGITIGELLRESPTDLNAESMEIALPDVVEVHLRADKHLSPEAAAALAQTFKAIYEQVRFHGIPKKL